MNLEIKATYTVGNQTFATEAEAQAFVAASERRNAIEALIRGLEPKRETPYASTSPTDWKPSEAARRYDASPGTLLRMAAAALQGRDAEALGIPAALADALAGWAAAPVDTQDEDEDRWVYRLAKPAEVG